MQALVIKPSPQVGEALAQASGSFPVNVVHGCHGAIEHVTEVHGAIRLRAGQGGVAVSSGALRFYLEP
jgi:hypothetical protein